MRYFWVMASSIIIIGAGASGLAAARRLSGAGFVVTVLEAGAEPGGRILSLAPGEAAREAAVPAAAGQSRFSGVVEGGAEFIHGELPLSLQLAKEAGVPLHPVRGQMVRLQRGKGLGSSGGDAFMGKDWDLLMERMEELREDEPIADFMVRNFSGDRYTALRDSVRRFAEGYDLADIQRVSTKALYNEWAREGEDEEYRPVGGYRRLVDFLVTECRKQGCVFHFSSAVAQVSWQPGRVEARTGGGQVFEADRMLVTVSLGVLQAGPSVLDFSPVIPDWLTAARQLGYGSVIKILLEFKRPFWEKEKKKDQTLFIISDESIPTWWTQPEAGSCLLTGWLAGGPMTQFQALDRQERIDSCLRSLASIFSIGEEELRELLSASLILDWAGAPYIRGGYSFDTVGAAAARAQLSLPVGQTIWFAGEALYEGMAPGTVEAAFTSGDGTAKKIIAQS
jgi:monoamine oxidase